MSNGRRFADCCDYGRTGHLETKNLYAGEDLDDYGRTGHLEN